MTTNTKFNTVLTAQTKVFLAAIESDKKTEQTKMSAVFTTAQAMTKGAFTGIIAEDGKKIGASHPLYVFGQILSYCQKFVDAGKKDLLISELKQADGSFIGLRKAKEFLPALGRDNGLADKFPTRAVGNTSKPKTEAEKTINVGREALMAMTLDELYNLSDLIESIIDEKTAQRKKPATRKAA